MRNVCHIARYTIRALISKRIIIGGVCLFAVFAGVVSLAGHFRVEEQIKIFQDVGMTFFSFFAFLCVVVCVPAVHASDREVNEDPLLIMRPVSRFSIIAGRFFGLVVCISSALIVGSFIFMGLLWLRFSVFPLAILPVLYLLLLKYGVFLSVMLLLSTCCHTIVASFSAIMLFLVSHGMAFYHGCTHGCAHGCEHSPPLLFSIVRALLPRFDLFSHFEALTFGTMIPVSYCISSTLYALFYGGCVFLLTVYLFYQKEW